MIDGMFSEGNKPFDGAVVINVTPSADEFEGEWDDGVGPSLRKVIRVTQTMLQQDKEMNGFELDTIKKLVVYGYWEPKPADAKGKSKAADKSEIDEESKAYSNSRADDNANANDTKAQIKLKKWRKKIMKSRKDPPKTHPLVDAESNKDVAQKEEGGVSCDNIEYSKEQLHEIAIAITRIAEVVHLMTKLETFEWKGGIPFEKELWGAIQPAKLKRLSIDIFRPGVTADPKPGDVLDLEDLRPLRNYVHLTGLTITGMLDSYQPMIWEAVWSMPNLKRLELRMALEPVLRRDYDWPFIQGDWVMRKEEDVSKSYHGDKGAGILNLKIGYGEYLDAIAMMKAKKVVRPGPLTGHEHFICIQHLVLGGFVIDAQPFLKVFSQDHLMHLECAHDCIDAGLAMPQAMLRNLKLSLPGIESSKQVRIIQYTPMGYSSYNPALHVPEDEIDPRCVYELTTCGDVVLHRQVRSLPKVSV